MLAVCRPPAPLRTSPSRRRRGPGGEPAAGLFVSHSETPRPAGWSRSGGAGRPGLSSAWSLPPASPALRGKSVAVLGGPGCGKTALIQRLAGVQALRPTTASLPGAGRHLWLDTGFRGRVPAAKPAPDYRRQPCGKSFSCRYQARWSPRAASRHRNHCPHCLSTSTWTRARRPGLYLPGDYGAGGRVVRKGGGAGAHHRCRACGASAPTGSRRMTTGPPPLHRPAPWPTPFCPPCPGWIFLEMRHEETTDRGRRDTGLDTGGGPAITAAGGAGGQGALRPRCGGAGGRGGALPAADLAESPPSPQRYLLSAIIRRYPGLRTEEAPPPGARRRPPSLDGRARLAALWRRPTACVRAASAPAALHRITGCMKTAPTAPASGGTARSTPRDEALIRALVTRAAGGLP
ncbi:MAG: hypothetical protein ACLRWL_05595 [Evtepia gabavorous]